MIKFETDFSKKLDVIIKSFNRPDCLERLVKSWNKRYSGIPLTIIDDSTIDMNFDSPPYRGHNILRLPSDQGISYGRNYGIKVTTKPYLLFFDDDFVISPKTKIEKMMALFSLAPNVGIVGGVMGKRSASAICQGGLLSIENGICFRIGLGDRFDMFKGIKYRYCDLSDNFFIADRRIFNEISWDNALKVTEHADFFLSIKNTGWKIVFTPDSTVEHHHGVELKDYYKYRFSRQGKYRQMMWQKHNLSEEAYIYEGHVVRRWVTPELCIDYHDNDIIKPLNKRLHNYVVLRTDKDDNGDIRSGEILSVGLGTYDENGNLLPSKWSSGERVYYNKSKGQALCSLGQIDKNEYVLISADEIRTIIKD